MGKEWPSASDNPIFSRSNSIYFLVPQVLKVAQEQAFYAVRGNHDDAGVLQAVQCLNMSGHTVGIDRKIMLHQDLHLDYPNMYVVSLWGCRSYEIQ